MGFFGKRFEQVAEEYLAHEALYAKNDRCARSNVRTLLRYFRQRPIRDIKPKDIEGMIAARLEEGVSKATTNRNRAALSKIFNLAIERGHHPGPNPVKFVKAFPESTGRTRYLTPAEAQRLVIAAAPHLKPLIVAALHTGARLNELLSLRWSDVDLRGRILYFRKEVTKARKQRMVPIVDTLQGVFRSLGPSAPDKPVFRYHGVGVHSVRTSFTSARKKARLRDFRFHDLRHTFSAWYVQRGGDLYRLQKYLGHSSIELTQRYAHLSPDFLKAGAEFFGPPPASPNRVREL